MKQKVIQIGSSAGVTISKESLEKIGINIGDMVETSSESGVFTIKPSVPQEKLAIDPQILQWGSEFITKNRELLKRLKDK
ncbi:hypothetical protein EXS62_01685 [Candidatus Kaiserbacteria bacterium]|nr:hypothetical protein [Candidatus Kaiserbacteria bacterium]